MQIIDVSRRLAISASITAGAMIFVQCTSTSSLTALSKQNMSAVAKIAAEQSAEEQGAENAPANPTQTSGSQDALALGTKAATGEENATAQSASNNPSTPPAPLTPVSSAEVGRRGMLTSLTVPSSQNSSTPQAASTNPIPNSIPNSTADIVPTMDPVAIPREAAALMAKSSSSTLGSVPLTPVTNRPTNQIMMVRTTAYTHSEADHLKYGRQSAAGTTLQYGSRVRSAAADWSKYPVGTRFMIEGLPYEYVVDDYGSALVGTETIDIYKPEKGTMNQWGVRNVPIRVLEWGSFEESRKILDGRKNAKHADHVRQMLREIEKKGARGSYAVASRSSS